MKGLIIKPKWADLILDGHKTLEVRGRNTKIRGRIGIIKSKTGKVYGTAELYDCVKLNKELFENNLKDNHLINMTYEELLEIYSNPYGWFLRDAERYNEPEEYKHKQGCVIWVNLD